MRAEGCDSGLKKCFWGWPGNPSTPSWQGQPSARSTFTTQANWAGLLDFFIAQPLSSHRMSSLSLKDNDKTFQYMHSPQRLTVQYGFIYKAEKPCVCAYSYTERGCNIEDVKMNEDYRGLASLPGRPGPSRGLPAGQPLSSRRRSRPSPEEVYSFFFISLSKSNDSLYLKLTK